MFLIVIFVKFNNSRYLEKQMAKIFLTGATGFVGSRVAEQLVLQHHEITCLIRDTSNLRWIENLPLKLCKGRLLDPHSYMDTLTHSTVFVHIAGTTKAMKSEDYYVDNFESTKVLLETIASKVPTVTRFLLVSSQAAVGPSPTPEPIDESYPCHPVTTYGRSKLMGEQVTLKFKNQFPVTIVRPPSVYGPRDVEIFRFFKNMNLGFNITVGNVDQLINIIHIDDLAKGIVQAAFSQKTIGNIYFLCDPTPYKWSEIADMTADIFEKKYLSIRFPYFVAYVLSTFLELISKISGKATILNREKMSEIKQPYWVISSAKAQHDFRFRTDYSLEAGLRNTIEWYKNIGWLKSNKQTVK